MCQLWHELREYGVHVGLYDKVIVKWLNLLLIAIVLLLTTLLQVFLTLLCSDVAGQIALLVGIQFTLYINRQECLAGKHLRACALEVMIDKFYLVYLTLCKLASQLLRYLDTLLHVG